MFTYHNNILCIQSSALYQDVGIVTKSNYDALVRRNKIKRIVRGGNGRTALVAFNSLPERFKAPIIQEFGDPNAENQASYLDEIIAIDYEAQDYFIKYRLSNGSSLPEEVIHKYTMNASVLKALNLAYTKRLAFRHKCGGGTRDVWATIIGDYQALDTDVWAHDLPKSGRRLKAKIKELKQRGYECLIHANYCNANSVKLEAAAKQWLLARWADRVQKCVSTRQLLKEFNLKAQERNWKVIKSSQALKNYLYRSDIKPLWFGMRYGDSVAKEKYTYQHSTKMPSMRDSLWYSDGTKLNYYYKEYDKDGKLRVRTCMVYEVMDAFSEVLLGYHISDTENYKAQYSAYKMAVGRSGFRPYQIGFDGQGGHKKLRNGNFLGKLAKLAINTQPHNGKSKTIENAFARYQLQFLKRDWFFTGMNINTKTLESKANHEFIMQNKYNLPTLEEIKTIYMQRREEWNNEEHPTTGIARIKMYHNSSNPESKAIELHDIVDMFWIQRQKPVRATAFGITFQEKNEKFTYNVFDKNDMPDMDWMRDNIDKKFIIKFDPEDMSMIWLYETDHKGQLRFVTEALRKIEVHRAIQEHEEGEKQWLEAIEKAKKMKRIETKEKMSDILRAEGRHVEDFGLNDTPLLGINSSRKHRKKNTKPPKASDIAKIQKEISNADDEVMKMPEKIEIDWMNLL